MQRLSAIALPWGRPAQAGLLSKGLVGQSPISRDKALHTQAGAANHAASLSVYLPLGFLSSVVKRFNQRARQGQANSRISIRGSSNERSVFACRLLLLQARASSIFALRLRGEAECE